MHNHVVQCRYFVTGKSSVGTNATHNGSTGSAVSDSSGLRLVDESLADVSTDSHDTPPNTDLDTEHISAIPASIPERDR